MAVLWGQVSNPLKCGLQQALQGQPDDLLVEN